MKAKILVLAISLLGMPLLATLDEHYQDDLEIAELIINLSQSITYDLHPPAIGAERMVTNASVSDSGGVRTYFIEGRDIYSTGRVLKTYWIRISKQITESSSNVTMDIIHDPGALPTIGRSLSQETQGLIQTLLNSIYKISEMRLDHDRVLIHHVEKTSSEPISFEIVGINNICEHVEQNKFKVIILRTVDHYGPSYFTQLIHPYVDVSADE